MSLSPWVALAVLLAVQLAWTLLVRAISPRIAPENARKLFHSGSGAILLAMPLLFDDVGPVFVWGALVILGMFLLMVVPALRERFAHNLYNVGRVSYGDFYFVLGVVMLFFLARENFYLYAVPLTMLSFADAVSAVVGKRFGRHKYEATDGRKSLEGSAAFFAVAFMSVLLWSPTLPNAQLWQVLLIAVILGFVVMLLEAIAWRGLDNLLIPLGGFILLRTYLMLPLTELLLHLAVVLLLVGFVLGWRRRTTLNHSALITAALFGYTVWTVSSEQFGGSVLAIAGWAWLLMPLAAFLVYNLCFAPELLEEAHESHNVDAVFSAVFAGSLWLYLAFYFGSEMFLFPFGIAFAAVIMNMFMEQRLHGWRMPRRSVLVTCIATSMLLVSVCTLMLVHGAAADTVGMLEVAWLLTIAVGGVATAMILRLLSEGVLNQGAHHRWRWHVRAVASLLGSASALVVAYEPLRQILGGA